MEDALKHVHACGARGTPATPESLAGSLGLSVPRAVSLITEMESRHLAQTSGAGLRLTPEGERLALQVIRTHRLLERYFADELRMPPESIHATADRREHSVTPADVDTLEARLGYPRRDPHGDPIPTRTGSLAGPQATALTEWPVGQPAEIVHIEDEPPPLFARIVAARLKPGMQVEVVEATRDWLVLWDGERRYALAPVAAANVFVAELPHPVRRQPRLSALRPGESARVRGLECEGLSRRRLLDLGLTPGTTVECVFASPVGEPIAYRVRGALIALRREQADEILIEPLRPEAKEGTA